MTNEMQAILQQARDTYGARNQISVAIEELCELATALSKFVRYDHEEDGVTKTRTKVLDEYADVKIVLEHVMQIYSITPEEELAAMQAKIDRLQRWLATTDSLEYSTVDRAVSHKEKWWCHNCQMPVEAEVTDQFCPACRQGLYFKGPDYEQIKPE